MEVQNKHVIAWLESCAVHLTEQQDSLAAPDRDIDDANRGFNMDRGFSIVKTTLPDTEHQHIGNVLKSIDMRLLSSVSGVSGPLYGTLFIRVPAVAGARTKLTLEEWLACLEEGIVSIVAQEKVEQGDKTLYDVWVPVLHEARKNLWAGISPLFLLNMMVQDAATAVDNTINIQTEKGRVSYFSAHSAGHQGLSVVSS